MVHGNAEAQFNLGMRLYRATIQARLQAVAESRIAAYQWLRLAAAQGRPEAETICDRVVLAMSREEVAEGNRRMAAFVAGPPTPAPSPS
jgi:TPR repeat protein